MLQAIETKFGTIYIEELNSEREEAERIKIFDSEKRYIDYIETEFIMDRADVFGDTTEEELNSYIRTMKECETIEELVQYIGINYELITDDWEEAASYMRPFCIDEYNSEDELLTNEWINKIGNYYIVVSEC